jgi:hypothetical protein
VFAMNLVDKDKIINKMSAFVSINKQRMMSENDDYHNGVIDAYTDAIEDVKKQNTYEIPETFKTNFDILRYHAINNDFTAIANILHNAIRFNTLQNDTFEDWISWLSMKTSK